VCQCHLTKMFLEHFSQLANIKQAFRKELVVMGRGVTTENLLGGHEA